MEQEEYTAEGIPWNGIEYNDNQPCVDLIEKSPDGVLPMLNEECKVPKGSDAGYLGKLHKKHGPNPYYRQPNIGNDCFIINHYATPVEYDTSGFLEKNKDALHVDMKSLTRSKAFRKEAERAERARSRGISAEARDSGNTSRARGGKKKVATVASEFKSQLDDLMSTIASSDTHYIRCIKPNAEKIADSFSGPFVLSQLRCSGMLEYVQIRQAGYGSRRLFTEFIGKFKILAPRASSMSDLSQAVQAIVEAAGIPSSEYKLGHSKIFIRDSQLPILEAAYEASVSTSAVVIQRILRGWHTRRRFIHVRKATVIVQSLIRGSLLRFQLKRQQSAALCIQTRFRGHHARLQTASLLEKKRAETKERAEKEKRDKAERELISSVGEPVVESVVEHTRSTEKQAQTKVEPSTPIQEMNRSVKAEAASKPKPEMKTASESRVTEREVPQTPILNNSNLDPNMAFLAQKLQELETKHEETVDQLRSEINRLQTELVTKEEPKSSGWGLGGWGSSLWNVGASVVSFVRGRDEEEKKPGWETKWSPAGMKFDFDTPLNPARQGESEISQFEDKDSDDSDEEAEQKQVQSQGGAMSLLKTAVALPFVLPVVLFNPNYMNDEE